MLIDKNGVFCIIKKKPRNESNTVKYMMHQANKSKSALYSVLLKYL